jgi:hypothetical protein
MTDKQSASFRPGMRVRHVMGDGGGLGLGIVESVTAEGVRVVFDAPPGHENEPVIGVYGNRWFRSMRAKLEVVADGA